jgi:hypothetical protein
MKNYPNFKIEKLKVFDCPFCGEQPEITKHFKEALWSLLHRCTVVGPITIEWREKLSDLVRTWNTRKEK